VPAVPQNRGAECCGRIGRTVSTGTPRLPRRIDAGAAAALVVGNVIGTGVFTTSGFIARDVGSPAQLMGMWLAGGVIAFAGALSYAELGAAMPSAGGEYVYLRRAYGSTIAFLSGWTSFAAGFSGAIAAALLGLVAYLHHFLPVVDAAGESGKALALLILWLLTAAHVAGSRPGARMQIALTIATAAAMLALIGAALLIGRASARNFAEVAPAHGSAAVALIFVLYSYSGWNAAAYVAGEMRNPGRSLPRALIAGTAIVTALYLAMNAMYLYALPIRAMSGVLPIAEKAAVVVLGPAGASAVSAIIVLALLGSASAMVMAGPRVYYAMAEDGLAPARLARLGARTGAPAAAIVAQSAWTSVLLLSFGTFEQIVICTGLAITLFSALAVAATIVLRVRCPELPRPFRMPGYPWLPLGYIAAAAWVAIYTAIDRPLEAAVAAAVVACGIPLRWLAERADAHHAGARAGTA
jgi:basic amino acid/polyamine antiporter, APA family